MISPSLIACRRVAQEAEHHALQLGLDWNGCRPILDACAEFQRGCDALAENRGLKMATIAFVGPKNAGKTTLISLLVTDENVRANLKIGDAAKDATTRPTWIASETPADRDRNLEDFIPCDEAELESLGFRYAILDVPGLDEHQIARRRLAVQALDNAHVKILAVRRGELETAPWRDYLAKTDGAAIVPVITHTPSQDDPRNALDEHDLSAFKDALQAHLSASVILPAIVMDDYDLPDADRPAILQKTRVALRQRLVEAIGGRSIERLAEPQLAAKLRHIKKEIASLAAQHLPATAQALGPIQDELRSLPEEAVDDLLGNERTLTANIRASLRATLLDRTPIFLFPWRLTLSIANLVHGATDRLPLALLGSPLSILTTASTTAKNLWNRVQFSEDIQSGLRRGVEARLKEKLSSRLTDLERNLATDLNSKESTKIHTKEKSTVRLIGLEILQSKSTGFFNDVIETTAPARSTAWVLGLLGFLMFWSILGQPLWGLYLDFFHAGEEVLARRASSIQSFPSDTFSMLATSTLLALLPMTLFLLLTVTWFVRESQIKKCIVQLTQKHEKLIEEMTGNRTLFAELSEPQLDSCRRLLAFESSGEP